MPNNRGNFAGRHWLPDMDLNHDKQIQSLLCYRYTIGQYRSGQCKVFGAGVKFGVVNLAGTPRRAPSVPGLEDALTRALNFEKALN